MTGSFEEDEETRGDARWAPLFHHGVGAAGAPGRARLAGWARAQVTDVVTLQRREEMAPWLEGACAEAGLRWHHFPLSGRRLEAAGDRSSVARLIAWTLQMEQATEPARIMVHCAAGLHRTGVALYVMMRCAGLSPEDALDNIRRARPLTADELHRTTRRGGRLVDLAEALFADASPDAPEGA